MVPSDLRKTNFVVDDVCTVRGKLIVKTADILQTTIHANTFAAPSIQTQTLETKNISIDGHLLPTPDFLFTNAPQSILASQIPEFVSSGSAEVKAVANTTTTSSSPLDYFFMSGRDGNQTITSSQTMTRDTYFDTLTIDATGSLDPAGFCIFCKTALINNGVIHRPTNNGGAGAGGIGGLFGDGQTNGTIFGGLGGANGGNTNVNGGSTATTQVFGGVGGTGGNSDTKTGGTSTASVVRYLNAPTPIRHLALFPEIFRSLTLITNMLGFIPSLGGGGGAGGSAGAGGGGGSGGGEIVIVAKTISGTGTFDVRGGAGGAGQTSAGGGGGGGGGVIYVMARNNTVSTSQFLVSGGLGGAGGAGGQNGVNGFDGLYQNNVVPS